MVGTKKNIKAFVQWVKDEIRYTRDPANTVFPIGAMSKLLRQHATHEVYVKESGDMAEAAKPEKLKTNTMWSN